MVEIEARAAGLAGELGSAARLRERRTGARQVPYGRGDVPARLLANLSRRSCGALPGLAPPWSEARGRRPLSAATPGLLSDRGEAVGQPGEDQSPRDWAPSAKTPAAKPRGQPLPPPCCQHNPSHLKVTPNSDQSSNQTPSLQAACTRKGDLWVLTQTRSNHLCIWFWVKHASP